MALINLKDLLANAKENKYAVGAFNISNLGLIDYLIEAAIEQRSPIILQVAEVHFKYFNFEKIARLIIEEAKNVNVPVCVHLDHGKSLSTILMAIKSGFTSVMFDGSEFPLEKNINETREIVKVAKSIGVSVEGEIGNVGGEPIGESSPIAHSSDKALFTKVEEAICFYEKTGVDALAISIGNVHGVYKGSPEIDFERLLKIKEAIPIPLVLHGGSGISNNDFKKAINLGICKINFYTEMSTAAVNKIKNYLSENPNSVSIPDVIAKGMEELKKVVKDRIEVFGSKNVCNPNDAICVTCKDSSCSIEESFEKQINRNSTYNELIEKIADEVILNLKR